MYMTEFRRLAAKIDQHMQRLAAEGVREPPAIIDRMMGYVPDLHKIWVGTSDEQLIGLSRQFPGFYRYAYIMEEASEAERNKPARPYDGFSVLAEEHKQRGAQLLVTAATLERGYQALRESASRHVSQTRVKELDQLHRQWLSDLDSFKSALRAQGTDAKTLAYVNEAFAHLAERIKPLTG